MCLLYVDFYFYHKYNHLMKGVELLPVNKFRSRNHFREELNILLSLSMVQHIGTKYTEHTFLGKWSAIMQNEGYFFEWFSSWLLEIYSIFCDKYKDIGHIIFDEILTNYEIDQSKTWAQ